MSQRSVQADKILTLIENRAAHIRSKLLLAVSIILDEREQAQRYLAGAHPEVTVFDLEEQVDHWRFLVPDEPDARAALLHTLGERYTFTANIIPRAGDVLGLQDEAVVAAYQQLYDAPLDSIFRDGAVMPEFSVETYIASLLEWVSLRRGETLFKKDDPGDHMYVIANGLLRVVIENPDEPDHPLLTTELDNGEAVGEISMLTGQERSATVYAVRDTELIGFSRANFMQLAEQHPKMMAEVAIRLSQRLSEMNQAAREPDFKPAATVAILHITPGVDDFMPRLMTTLAQHSLALHLRPNNVDEHMRAATGIHLEEYVDEYDFVDGLQRLSRQFDMIIYETNPAYPNWTRRCISEADRILLVGRAGESDAISAVEQIMADMPHRELLPQRELVLLHAKRNNPPEGTSVWLDKRRVARHHHVALDSDAGFERVSRFLRGQAVGLVFGGGGMRGGAHVGVINVLNEMGIPVDVVGGTSSGALVAAQFALGWPTDKITQTMKEKFFSRRAVIQPTFPWTSFSSARFLNHMLTEAFGEIKLEDLWTTAFTISLNWTTARMSVNTSGKLRWAVRASTSLAGTHPPLPDENGDLHIDGGGANNTPADIARHFVGTGPVIAVDLGFTDRASQKYHYGEYLSGFSLLFNRLNPFRTECIKAPLLFDIMLRANALGSINATAEQVKAADLLLQPPVGSYGLFDTDQYDAIVEIGYRHASEKVAEWKANGGLEKLKVDG